jgi:hypothetical protein
MEEKQDSLFKRGYQNLVGDFSVKSLINIGIILGVTMVLPFFLPDFSFKTFLSVGFWSFTILKLAINLYAKATFLLHTINMGFVKDKDIVILHNEIKESRKTIDTLKYNMYLPKAIREENLRNRLDDLYDDLNIRLSKSTDDEEVERLTLMQESVEEYLEALENNKPTKDIRKTLTRELSKMKTNVLTRSSLYSKNDTTKRAKEVGIDIAEATKKFMYKTTSISIALVIGINGAELIKKGWSTETLIAALINVALVVYSSMVGVDGGNKILERYKGVAIYKSEFLKSFILKAEHYSKPNPDDVKEQLEKDKLAEKEKESIERVAQADKEKLDRQYEIDKLKADRKFELEKARITADTEMAKATILASQKPVSAPLSDSKTKEDKSIGQAITLLVKAEK